MSKIDEMTDEEILKNLKPNKPIISIIALVITLIAIIGIIITIPSSYKEQYNKNLEIYNNAMKQYQEFPKLVSKPIFIKPSFDTELGAIFSFLILSTPFIIRIALYLYNCKHLDKYRNNIIKKRNQKYENNVALAKYHLEHQPKCPICNSTSIEKIGTTGKILSIGLFGISSSDIGKTMKCNNCGYKF